MLEVFGKEYYIDIDEVIKKCRPDYELDKKSKNIKTSIGENGETVLELNVFKFEVFKACIERVLSEIDETDPDLGAFAKDSISISFKMAFNTLLKYEILIEN